MSETIYTRNFLIMLVAAILFYPLYPTISEALVPPACPISPAPSRTIFNFPSTKRIVAFPVFNSVPNTNFSGPITATLPAGQYKVTLVSYDGYDGRQTVSQTNEQYFVTAESDTAVLASSGYTDDLPDLIVETTVTTIVNDTGNLLNVPDGVTRVYARHRYPNNPPDGSPNSLLPICAAFEFVPPPAFDSSCNGAPSTATIGESVVWTATASGGTGAYSYSWSGDESLSSVNASTTKNYTTSGTKNATVNVTSGANTLVRTCSVSITTPPPFDASCTGVPSSPRLGQPVTWFASASGGTGTYTYSWSGHESLSGTGTSTTKSYSSIGIKDATVSITSGVHTVVKTCSVTIPDDRGCAGSCGGIDQPTVVLSQKTFLNPPETTTPKFIYLSEIPYTGYSPSPAGLIALAIVTFGAMLSLWNIFNIAKKKLFSARNR